MSNERLRAAILSSDLNLATIAARVGVDPKTIEKWVAGRPPHRRNRYALASVLGRDVSYLWADEQSPQATTEVGQAELVSLYPHRSVVPNSAWTDLYSRAIENIDVLVYAGFWLSEDPLFLRIVREKAQAGARVRFLLGDPNSESVAQRGADEGIGDAMASKIRNALVNYTKLFGLPRVEFRVHGTVLYNSIYRADNELLVNTHVHGVGAYLAPVLHIRRLPQGTMFATYAESIDRVWSEARPLSSPTDFGDH
ncbi:helix-turn-helix domain-containing protein [Embleya hyalina]|uniref:Transcriptional regulator n=1 Tax=Embleya hyalina TaxID=516124 RepID=A0A401YGM6_9ACTN|nr:helix-turn-helix transcriptional regulator [Embleya hyalina]GCD93765.1 transcriptional regulator [Embleya hyalina]